MDAAFRGAMRCSSAAHSVAERGVAGPRGLFASAVVPDGIPPKAALARRTLWLVKRSSLVVLFLERPGDNQWRAGSRLVFRSWSLNSFAEMLRRHHDASRVRFELTGTATPMHSPALADLLGRLAGARS